jgi:hypothetical protein
LVIILSLETKNPLPRESVAPLASKVSMATAEGLMRRTSSGRKSCADAPEEAAKNKIRKAEILKTTDFIAVFIPFSI